MQNEVFLLYHSYSYGKFKQDEATKILGVYSSEKSAKKAINRYWKIPNFNKFPKKCFKINKFKIDNDTWYVKGFDNFMEPIASRKDRKYTKMYMEFSVESPKDSLIDDLNSLTNLIPTKTLKIGEISHKRVVKTNLWQFETKFMKTPISQDIADKFCDIFEPFAEKLGRYIKENDCKAAIYFIIYRGENGVSAEFDTRLAKLALNLNCNVYFDGI